MFGFFAIVLSLCIADVYGQCAPQKYKVFEPVLDKKTGLFEGDIRLSKEQLRSMRRGTFNVIKPDDKMRWGTKGIRGAVVPYRLSTDYSEEERNVIIKALSSLSNLTDNCIRFVPRTTEEHYVYVIRKNGCSSPLGRDPYGFQFLNLDYGCITHGVVQHEFLHALGFLHEQARGDRDEYVTIMWENILEYACSNFYEWGWAGLTVYGQPYDYGSVMHYSATEFSRNGKPTIVAKDPSVTTLGQRNGATKIDIAKLKGLYQC